MLRHRLVDLACTVAILFTASQNVSVPQDRTYIVFFEFDSYGLTEQAKKVIEKAAAAVKSINPSKVEVWGHTDTATPDDPNDPDDVKSRQLSLLMARSVADELVADGVPRTSIVIASFGATRPLVPTGPGVREEHNQRVEIILD